MLLCDRLKHEAEGAADDGQPQHGHPFLAARGESGMLKEQAADPSIQRSKAELEDAEEQPVGFVGQAVGDDDLPGVSEGAGQAQHSAACKRQASIQREQPDSDESQGGSPRNGELGLATGD
ncbi:hypothetical protein D3C73_1379820 [compost metagenome]